MKLTDKDMNWLKTKQEEMRRIKKDGHHVKEWDIPKFLKIIQRLQK